MVTSPELEVHRRIETDAEGLVVHRHEHPSTRLTPVFADGFSDDGSPVLDFPAEFLLVFDRDAAGAVAGVRLSGQRARGIRFARTG